MARGNAAAAATHNIYIVNTDSMRKTRREYIDCVCLCIVICRKIKDNDESGCGRTIIIIIIR
jgi:hypothetical protein